MYESGTRRNSKNIGKIKGKCIGAQCALDDKDSVLRERMCQRSCIKVHTPHTTLGDPFYVFLIFFFLTSEWACANVPIELTKSIYLSKLGLLRFPGKNTNNEIKYGLRTR